MITQAIQNEIEDLTAQIKAAREQYDDFLIPNEWKHPTAETMRQSITALVDLRCDLEDMIRLTRKGK